MKSRKANVNVPLTGKQAERLRKLAGSHACLCRRGPRTGDPSIAVLLQELGDGKLTVVPVKDHWKGKVPEWWSRDKSGTLAFKMARRRLTEQQETWCARRLEESDDGLSFLASESWFDEAPPSETARPERKDPERPEWWLVGEMFPRDGIQKKLGSGVDVDEWAEERGIEWSDDNWGAWPGDE